MSVIIPTINRSSLLEKTLDSITRQTLANKHYEVIVVDNGSIDSTANVCERYMSKLPGFRRIFDSRPGLHVGRHIGLNNAKGNILVYGDDDIEAFPTWLEGIYESFLEPEIVLVGGKIIPKYETVPPQFLTDLWTNNGQGKMLSWLSLLNCGDKVRTISPYLVWGCNFSIRKNVLLEIGGFHPDGMPQELIKYRGDGETTISREIERLGYKVIYNPMASVHHWVPKERMTEEYFKRRAFNQGISGSYTQLRSQYFGDRSNTIMKRELFKRVRDKSIGQNITSINRRIIIAMQKISKLVVKKHTPLEQIIDKAYVEGFAFHQNEVKKDPQLLKWVLKQNYFLP